MTTVWAMISQHGIAMPAGLCFRCNFF